MALTVALGGGIAYLFLGKNDGPPPIAKPKASIQAAVKKTIPSLKCDPTTPSRVPSQAKNEWTPNFELSIPQNVQALWTELKGATAMPENTQMAIAELNQELKPEGDALILTADNAFFARYPIQMTRDCTIADHEAAENLTVLFLGSAQWHMGTASNVELFTDRSQGTIFVPMEEQAQRAQQLGQAFIGMGLRPKGEFPQSMVTDRLRYEATGWLLADRFAALDEAAKSIKITKQIPGTAKQAELSGDYTPKQVLHLCQHGAEFAESTQAALWTFTAMVGQEAGVARADDDLSLSAAPFYLASLTYSPTPPAIRLLNNASQRPPTRKALREVVVRNVGLQGVQSMGREMYAACYDTLGKWRAL